MSRRQIILRIVWAAVGTTVAAALLLPVTVHERTNYTCLLCRAKRTDHRAPGWSWQRFEDSEFTPWHHAHRPAHVHQWERQGCIRGNNIVGQTTLWRCGRNHPIEALRPRDHLDFALAASPSQLSNFYAGILSTNRATQEQAVNEAWTCLLDRK